MQVPSMRLFREKITALTNSVNRKLDANSTAYGAVRDGDGNNIADTYATKAYIDSLPPGYRLDIRLSNYVNYTPGTGSPGGSWNVPKRYVSQSSMYTSYDSDMSGKYPLRVGTTGRPIQSVYQSSDYRHEDYTLSGYDRNDVMIAKIIESCSASGNFSGRFSATMNLKIIADWGWSCDEERTSSGSVTIDFDGSTLKHVSHGISFPGFHSVGTNPDIYYYFTLTDIKIQE